MRSAREARSTYKGPCSARKAASQETITLSSKGYEEILLARHAEIRDLESRPSTPGLRHNYELGARDFQIAVDRPSTLPYTEHGTRTCKITSNPGATLTTALHGLVVPYLAFCGTPARSEGQRPNEMHGDGP